MKSRKWYRINMMSETGQNIAEKHRKYEILDNLFLVIRCKGSLICTWHIN